MTDLLTEPQTHDLEPRRSGVDRPRVVVVALAVGVMVDLALHTRAAGTAMLVAVALLVVGLARVGGVSSVAGTVLVGAAVVPAALFALRASAWVLVPAFAATGLLLALGASSRGSRPLWDRGFAQLARQVLATGVSLVMAPPFLVASAAGSVQLDQHRRRAGGLAGGVLRGLVVAVPIAGLIAFLLASGDSVFASLLDLSVDVSGLPAHLWSIVAGAVLAAALLRQSFATDSLDGPAEGRRIGSVEAIVVLLGLIVVHAVFAVSRLVVAVRGAEYVVETTGLTYAEYARSGFFQLLWAAGITLVVLIGIRSTVVAPSTSARRAIAVLSVMAVGLTLLVVHTAIVRLDLYEEAFGLTMLRLASTVAAWWIGAVFVLVGLAFVGLWSSRAWLAAAVVASVVVGSVAFGAADPEAIVARRNLERAAQGHDFDVAYASSLSEDAVPVLVEGLPLLSEPDRDALRSSLCRRRQVDTPVRWNAASLRAAQALDELCST